MKDTLIIGGGVAGISVALELANRGLQVGIVEKNVFPGGHGVQFACKATDACVKCGACLVEQKLFAATGHPNIEMMTGSTVSEISRSGNFWELTIHRQPMVISHEKCNNCGACIGLCPQPGALLQASSAACRPFVAVDVAQCRAFQGDNCAICSDQCPENAFCLDAASETIFLETENVVLSTGFRAFHPVDKPYGYGIFQDVITNLELETMLRNQAAVKRISDGASPRTMAFIQCVGSRDASLGHLWCSRVCCGSALRMAQWIRRHSAETEVTVFYMDIQTFGKDFEPFYENCRIDLKMIRAIPGDIHPTKDNRLQVTYFEPDEGSNIDEIFDMVILSVGIMPNPDTADLAAAMDSSLPEGGFLDTDWMDTAMASGIFTAGTVQGAMSIADTVADAQKTAFEILRHRKQA